MFLFLGHVLHGGVIPDGEGGLYLSAGFIVVAKQTREAAGGAVFRAPRSPGRQHFLQQHCPLQITAMGLLHRIWCVGLSWHVLVWVCMCVCVRVPIMVLLVSNQQS